MATQQKSIPIRRLKIGYKRHMRRMRRRSRCILFPCLLLSGKWLQQHGFEHGDEVQVSCSTGRLVITIAETN